ncbi:RING-H2 finger protein ATL3-like [Salvia miltiorrhiza]|uniref:RING-H2 finger protein ATL3-like n=1 Tax=Salvia miltiorrhiza TaxID=226208 RepID=UPI0025AC3E6D|nr:RING-H2 finger protein ATL3-like [Salvia miltiorrhiza]
MGDASERNGGKFGDTGVIELTGKIMVVAIVLLFFVVVFVFCLHLYAKWFWYRRQDTTATTATRRRRRLEFAPPAPALRRGLEPSLLKTIPVIMFDPKQFKDGLGLECAVCLCEICEGEKARLLPKCNHGFHVDCIDMWFQSHSTCPLCRNPVSNSTNSTSDPSSEAAIEAPIGEGNVNAVAIEIPNFPTNVLIWGNESQVSTFGPCGEEGHHQGNETSSSSSSSMASSSGRPEGVEEDEQKSAVPTRLRTLKRLLSGNRRVNPSSPRNLDLEQGVRGLS